MGNNGMTERKEYEQWFEREFPRNGNGQRLKYHSTYVEDLMFEAYRAGKIAAAPTQGADERPVAIYQFIATDDTDGTPLWRDCDADEYTNYAKDMRRVVRAESDNAPVEMCKCRQLGDWKGFHHPLCNESRSVAEWLDERRDCTVSEVFHDVMARIVYATRDAAPSDAISDGANPKDVK
jgi:hypothetical protein